MVASVVVYKYDLVCKLIKYIPVAAEGCQNQLAGSMSIEGFEAQLAPFARSWGKKLKLDLEKPRKQTNISFHTQ